MTKNDALDEVRAVVQLLDMLANQGCCELIYSHVKQLQSAIKALESA